MRIPGFTAESSLYKTKTSYRASSFHGALSQGGGIVPQKGTACYQCSSWLLGSQYCCDGGVVICTPEGVCHIEGDICYTRPCGLLPWLVDIIGTVF
jgi:hypothetical protein